MFVSLASSVPVWLIIYCPLVSSVLLYRILRSRMVCLCFPAFSSVCLLFLLLRSRLFVSMCFRCSRIFVLCLPRSRVPSGEENPLTCGGYRPSGAPWLVALCFLPCSCVVLCLPPFSCTPGDEKSVASGAYRPSVSLCLVALCFLRLSFAFSSSSFTSSTPLPPPPHVPLLLLSSSFSPNLQEDKNTDFRRLPTQPLDSTDFRATRVGSRRALKTPTGWGS